MHIALAIVGAAVLLFALYIVLILPGRKHADALSRLTGKPYAHRGLHDAEAGVPENTLLAFERAAKNGYGMEFDVRFTGDRQLVIMHDNELERMTGCKGKVSEMTLAQLGELRVGGTDQGIPRFEQMLELVNGRVPLIVELKVCDGDYAELAEAVCGILDGYRGEYVIESFDPRLVRWLRKNRPDIVRGQLLEFYRRHGNKDFPVLLNFLVCSQIINAWGRPDFIAINHDDRDTFAMKLLRKLCRVPEFDWTVRSQQQADASRADGSAYIFEGFIPEPHDR